MNTRHSAKSHIDKWQLVTAALFVCLAVPLAATAQYRIDRWTADDGLPQNSVTGLTRTLDGYIWLTTNDGLVRFNGAGFKVFNKSNTPELTTNRLVGAFGDKSGRLWFQSEDGAVMFYEKGAFTVAVKPHEIPPVMRSPFFDDQTGGVIFYANHQNYRYQAGGVVPFKAEGLPEGGVIVLADRDGGLWFTNEAGVHRLKDGMVKTFELKAFSKGEVYKVAYEDRHGGVWLGYAGEVNRPSDAKLLRIKDGRVQSFRFPAKDIWHFAEDREGNLWVTVYNKGIYRIESRLVGSDDPVNDTVKPVAVPDGITANTSGVLMGDREGGMWVGTERGLLRILPQTIHVLAAGDGLPEENVYPIYEDSGGKVWAGIWQNSLVCYEGGSFKTYLKSPDTYFITSLFEDRAGRFWFGNIDTLRYLDKGRPVDFTSQAGFRGYTEISVISQDSDGALWFGTSQGLSRYADGQAKVFTKEDGLPDDYVVAFLQARGGKIWVGTRGGLASIENGMIRAFTTADGLASNYIRSLYEDADGVLWVGSYDGGLTRLKDGKFTRFTVTDGLTSSGVFCILEDRHGWFWINSNQGIYRVSRQELNDFADGKTKFLTSIAYNKQDGLLNVEGNGGRQPAGVMTRDGKLWFPTAQGIAVIDPEAIVVNPLPPPVLIEEISIERKPVDNGTFQSAVLNRQSPITLSPNQNNLEIQYAGLSFINSGQVKFRYQLEGLDRDWNEVGTRRTAYYSYLPPGDYTFRVIAANRDGVWNTEGASLRVRVLPPFYRTWGFIILCLFGVLVVTALAYRHRVGRLTKPLCTESA